MLKCWITTHRGKSGYQQLSGRTPEVTVTEFHSSPGNSVLRPSFGAITFYLFISHINNTWLAVLLQRLHVWVKAWFLQSNMPETFYLLLVPFNPTMMPILQLRKLTHEDTSGSFWTKTKGELILGPEPLTDILQPPHLPASTCTLSSSSVGLPVLSPQPPRCSLFLPPLLWLIPNVAVL